MCGVVGAVCGVVGTVRVERDEEDRESMVDGGGTSVVVCGLCVGGFPPS